MSPPVQVLSQMQSHPHVEGRSRRHSKMIAYPWCRALLGYLRESVGVLLRGRSAPLKAVVSAVNRAERNKEISA